MSNEQKKIQLCPTCGSECTTSWSGLELVENTGNETLAQMHYHYDNPYKTACEAINKDNPMAVAENLELMVRYYSELLIVTESYKYGDLDVYNRLLSKIKSK